MSGTSHNLRPSPRPTTATQGYWDAAARKELAVQRCRACQRYVHPPRPLCPWCSDSESSFETVSGRGRLNTYSVIHRSFAPGFTERTPYVIAWVELLEQPGLRIFANIVDSGHEHLRIGELVEVVFDELEDFGRIPQFRLVLDPERQNGSSAETETQ